VAVDRPEPGQTHDEGKWTEGSKQLAGHRRLLAPAPTRAHVIGPIVAAE
jgi:hypothetical protein